MNILILNFSILHVHRSLFIYKAIVSAKAKVYMMMFKDIISIFAIIILIEFLFTSNIYVIVLYSNLLVGGVCVRLDLLWLR